MSLEKFVTLKTSDGQEFKLHETIAMRSQVIKHLIEDKDHASKVIPLSNINGKTMDKVVEYWKKHEEEGVSEDQLKNFDKNFSKEDRSMIYELLIAAKNLEDKELLNVMIQVVVDRIKDKSLEEVREELGIENDFTPEEEEKIRKENNYWGYI